MNPAVEERIIQEAYEADEVAAAAEYGAQFRKDVDSFIARDAVEACVIPDRRELPPVGSTSYVGFVDPSGGSQDSMTLAIAHEEQGRAVLDLIREVRPPFAPSEVVADFADVLKSYGVLRVVGDRYGGEWPREQFRSHGITYEPADRTKSDLYKEVLPLLNSGRGPDPGRQRDFTGDQDLGRGACCRRIRTKHSGGQRKPWRKRLQNTAISGRDADCVVLLYSHLPVSLHIGVTIRRAHDKGKYSGNDL